MRPQSHPGVIANGQSQIAEATFSVPIRAISARKFRRNTGYQGGAKGLKAMWGGGKLWPVAWSITGLEYTYAIIRKPCRERDTRARHFPGGRGRAHLRRLCGRAEGELPDAVGTVCRDAAGGGRTSASADRALPGPVRRAHPADPGSGCAGLRKTTPGLAGASAGPERGAQGGRGNGAGDETV